MRKITKAGLVRRIDAARMALGRRIASGPAERDDPGAPICALKAHRRRREGTVFVGHPASWRVEFPPLADPAPIGVVLHAHYPELVTELVAQLATIPVDFDLLVTTSADAELDLSGLERTRCRSHRVLPVENRGRDLWPLAQLVNAGLLDPYDLVLKVHTKRSAWREGHELAGTGEEWKDGFLRDLLGSEANVAGILASMLDDPSLGIVTADGSICGPEQWGGDERIVRELLRRLELRLAPGALRFASGSMYWIRGFLLQGLRALELEEGDFEDEAGQIDATTAHGIERLLGIVAEEAGFRVAERSELADGSSEAAEAAGKTSAHVDADALAARLAAPEPIARAVAYYLPQFHPFDENDAWWGEGFTEWTNVAKARPLFTGHAQPLLPSDLGFTDLRLDEVRERQAALAERAGLAGFMYYYYWFSGTRLMDLPIERLAASGLEQPFAIMWANENWTRRWDGAEQHVLIAQEYERVPAEQFIDDVMHLLKDPRYLRVDGEALLAVYRIAQIPDYPRVLEHWRRRAREEGVGELHLVAVDVGAGFDGLQSSYEAAGMQGFVAFPPHNHLRAPANRSGLELDLGFRGNLYDYGAMARDAERRYAEGFPANDYPGAMANFDNTARRHLDADVWVGSNPYTFRRWLRAAAEAVADRDPEHRIVIVNAWNEWAEGAVLEPSQRYGRTYLQATRSALVTGGTASTSADDLVAAPASERGR
ncbi:hypothetical protein USB125703_00484 [Pseudoclavibacter triregionum]|nr:hypothetical protein USB125703_00484 [Pseudoclavibacter triregionum]